MCLKGPTVTPPTLGGGLSIAPPSLGTFSGSIDLCCKIVPYSTPPLPPILVSGVFNPAVAAALKSAIGTINTYLSALTVDCPLE